MAETWGATPDWPGGDSFQTFGDVVDRATEMFRKEALPDPRNLAIRIYRASRGPARYHAPLPDADELIPEEEVERVFDMLTEVAWGRPIAYSVGWTGFRNLAIYTDRRALIPRPETEGLVELALARVRTGVAADIGTGSGAIALSLAQEGAFDQVIGCDLSREALVLARRNGRATGLKVSWRLGDLLAPLRGRPVDLLVSNPPYLSVLEYDALDEMVRNWEPATALIGGSDGLDYYRRLLTEGIAALRPGGWIALEIDARRAAETAALATAHDWQDVRVFDDLFGRARYLLARREETL